MTIQRLPWCVRQLLPLRYQSQYRDSAGTVYYSEWRMWFGRVFRHRREVIARFL